jgi:RNA polymerase sigma factor (TIGR02999 family)
MRGTAATPPEITDLLQQWGAGRREALDELLPYVYEELRRQAARYLRRERAHHTLQTSDLIHEAYLRLLGRNGAHLENRSQFFAVAAQAMRRILVDYARAKRRDKRGGENIKLTLDEASMVAVKAKSVDLLALDEALTRLAQFDEPQARVVELRYFSGLSLEETADALHISRATVARDWNVAKAWLHRELSK